VTIQLEPVQRRLVSEAVFEQLLSDVIAGRLQPGDALPSERTLSEAFEVNRHAVREAIKRLQQAGLVQVAQGGATRVLDWRRSAGLDLLTSLATAARGPEQQALLKDIVEMRAVVGADVARRCAERAPGTRLTPVDPSLPFEEKAEQYIAFWEAITEGAGNLAYRLALNTLVAAQRTGPIDPHLYTAEIDDPDAQRALAGAIAAKDPKAAARLATDLLERAL
jgi:GntR family transcriptional regulator, transcriptional repressor for pyruvate dehydrogenase complex